MEILRLSLSGCARECVLMSIRIKLSSSLSLSLSLPFLITSPLLFSFPLSSPFSLSHVFLSLSQGRKVVVITHSMGSNLWYYFMKWVESEEGGRGGDRWVEDNIEGVCSLYLFNSLSITLSFSLST